MIKSSKDFWSGLLYIFFGAGAVIIGRDYSMGTALRMGPAYFPTLLGGLLCLVGLVSLVRSFIVQGTPVGKLAIRQLAVVTASVALFGMIVRGAGLGVALPLLIMTSAMASTRFRWLPSIAMAAGLTVFCVFVFLHGLGIPLPLIGSWLGGD